MLQIKKNRKYSVLLRYQNFVRRKLHIARNEMNEPEISKWKEQKMKYMFLDSQPSADYAKHGFTHSM